MLSASVGSRDTQRRARPTRAENEQLHTDAGGISACALLASRVGSSCALSSLSLRWPPSRCAHRCAAADGPGEHLPQRDARGRTALGRQRRRRRSSRPRRARRRRPGRVQSRQHGELPAGMAARPKQWKQGVCTATQIIGLLRGVPDPAHLGAPRVNRSCRQTASCAPCLQSQDTDPTAAAIVWHEDMKYWTVNVAGCIAEATWAIRAATGCGAAYAAAIACRQSSCNACWAGPGGDGDASRSSPTARRRQGPPPARRTPTRSRRSAATSRRAPPRVHAQLERHGAGRPTCRSRRSSADSESFSPARIRGSARATAPPRRRSSPCAAHSPRPGRGRRARP